LIQAFTREQILRDDPAHALPAIHEAATPVMFIIIFSPQFTILILDVCVCAYPFDTSVLIDRSLENEYIISR
jgi:hypothetical protein